MAKYGYRLYLYFVLSSTYNVRYCMNRFEEYECEPGYYCVDGLRYACSPGYFGMYARETSLPIAEIMDESWIMGRCSGPCQPGYYCPFASASATNFPCGRYDLPLSCFYQVLFVLPVVV